MKHRNDLRARSHPAYWAFLMHRLSGLALALFLPLHFWALGQALHGAAALDGFLKLADQPLFKLAEWGLVVLLAATACGQAPPLPAQPGLVSSELIYEKAPFPQCHASTIAETSNGLVAAWFAGTREG